MRLCVIPARGGSKRIPRKNIKEFCGKPMIAWSIESALKSNLFDEIMVSTEDQEIVDLALKFGAKVPFLRSQINSDDFTGPGDVMVEVLSNYEKNGTNFKEACCLFATAPLLSSKRLQEAHNLFTQGVFDVVFPVGKFNSPIMRSFTINEKEQLFPSFPKFQKYRSQDLPNNYYDAGQFYWFLPGVIKGLQNKNLFGNKKGAIILRDYEVQDIDELSDWTMAELKFKYLSSLKKVY